MSEPIENKSAEKKKRVFDFLRYPQRRIALMFLYLGWEFEGFVAQADSTNTTEDVILNAMERCKLIRSRDHAQWNRCGRTDKRVSGFRQVGSCVVRSTDVKGKHVEWAADSAPADSRCSTSTELDYPRILNAVLPPAVRVLAWAPVDREFNARFKCKERVYRYVFPRSNFDVERMNDACSRLVGEHDFRNFCQIDNSKCRLETTYVRVIFVAEIVEICPDATNPVHSMFQLTVKGSGFLWHQIRFIASLLFEVGAGNEEPRLISDLLDVHRFPARPCYLMARDLPLCFFDCSYDFDLGWQFDSDVLLKVVHSLQKQWTELRIKTEIIRNMMNELHGLAELPSTTQGIDEFVRDSKTVRSHVPVLKRPLCESLDARIAKATAKRVRLEDEKPTAESES